MRVVTLSKRESESLLQRLRQALPHLELPRRMKDIRVLLVDDSRRLIQLPQFRVVEVRGTLLPFLGEEGLLRALPAVVVDPGAVRFVVNGANVMRPGVVRFEGDFRAGDVVGIRESKHSKFIAVGLALKPLAEAEAAASGPVVRNLHYVGDRLWEAAKELRA
jgi:PUA domain protein